ncbi:tyrosine-type recombinase/integrase [Aequorivita xiaoshiensis]|uniref:Site-specific integrase n=1 Tax=Aequorivita xiaoshiensis TaxID=2874476 RepID=A0A9X1R2T8_9FLAO|nr:tyrosine-type recombinase/integrase [Aequorivita xiaoshiensis]MCG2431261.1 site-specific integrase [Aequorivita xiaoshiensis]
MDLKNYKFEPGAHRNKPVIWVRFPYHFHLKNALKRRFPSAKWSQSNKSWYLLDTPAVREVLYLPKKNNKDKLLYNIHPVNQQAMLNFVNQLNLKAYSENTIRVYCTELKHLLLLLNNYPVEKLTPEKLKSYFLYCLKYEKMKERKLNGKINAIKFYFEQVLHREKMFFDIPRPKKPATLPKTLTQREISLLFKQVTNIKHLLALQLCYGMGLRVSEVVNLKLEHINSKDGIVLIAQAKGKKDRYVPLPNSILPLLRRYYFQYKPKKYLLEGRFGGQYSKGTVQTIFRKALKNAGIKKNVGLHGLRHSYASHLLQTGTDIRLIQDLLGHYSIKTTMIYTNVTQKQLNKIKSPLDSLNY